MIIESVDQFPALKGPMIAVDVETASFDPISYGNSPYDGVSKICSLAVCDSDEATYYFPIRHYNVDFEHHKIKPWQEFIGNLPIPEVTEFFSDALSRFQVVNHNIKFDARFWTAESMYEPRPWDQSQMPLLCTMTMARHIECDRLNYNLDRLGKDYVDGSRKLLDEKKAYMKSLPKWDRKECKDFGLIPIPILGSYAEQDARLTYKLYHKLLSKMEESSHRPWNSDTRFLMWMLCSEIHGIPVNIRSIKLTKLNCLRKMLKLTHEIIDLADEEFDPGSDKDLTNILIGKFGVVPKAFTKKAKKPQWNGMALRTLTIGPPPKTGSENDLKKHQETQKLVTQLGTTIADYKNESSFMSSFCDGWLRRIGTDGRLHADFRIAGTATGRPSCKDPNLFNVPPRAENFVEVDDDRIIVGWDYSQIEYRIFGHYTQDPFIVSSYQNDPKADFHGLLASQLGVDRQFAKQLNFSFLYGMGKGKLLTNLAGILTLKADESDEMKEKMRLMAYGAGTSISERAKQLDATEETKLIALGIYNEYHKRFPSIKAFQNRVYQAIRVRGWIKNYFGRVYRLPMMVVHKGVNYIIQGSAADLFKDRVITVFDTLWGDFDFWMITNVYDSIYFNVARSQAVDFYNAATPLLEADLGLRVPIRVEGKVSSTTWARVEKVKDDGVEAAIARSNETKARLAGVAAYDWDDREGSDVKTSGRYDFSGTGN